MEQIIINADERIGLYGEGGKYNDYNLFIEAGAGAGKTETIINLIVAQLYSGVSPEKIVAITFTNKATEELINRISEVLSEKINNEGLSSDKLAILQNALDNLYKMNVSTIHHFCNVILNENSYKAKLSFNSTLLEEDDEEKRRNDFYYSWVHKLSRKDIKAIALSSPDAFKNLKKTYDALCNQFDDINVIKNIPFDYKEIFKKIFELYDTLEYYHSRCKYVSYSQKFIDAFTDAKALYGIIDEKDLFEKCLKIEAFKSIRKDLKFSYDRNYSATKEEVLETYESEIMPLAEECVQLKELVKSFINAREYEITNNYAISAWNEFKEARDRSSLCNNQLIYETYKLLSENPDVKEKLAKEYDVILVDEFQDTDKYQNKFIIDLAIAIDERKEKENKQSTSIILVGDPKQSIYGFRGADFELFMKTKQNFSTCGLKKAINVFFPDNYRSNEYILNWVNNTYQTKEFFPGYKYEDMVLPMSNKLPSTSSKDILAGVYSYNFNNGDNKYYNYALLVKKIKENNKIFKRDGKNMPLEEKEIKYSDFLILTTSHTEINNFIMAFNKVGIKTLVAGEFDLCSSNALNYIYRILMYVLDGKNNINSLFESDFNSNIYNNTKLDEIKENTKSYTPYGKLLYLFNNIELIIDEFDDCDKELLKTILSQIIENVCFNKSLSALDILNEVEKLLHNSQEAELSLMPKEDSVRIMNVHKSKGLTAEIVIIADSGGFKTDDSCKVLGDKIYLNNISLYPLEQDQYRKNKNSEKLRLEYVASTRAKQVLIFEANIKSENQLFNRSDEKYNLESLNDYHIESALKEIDMTDILDSSGPKKITKASHLTIDNELSNIKCLESSPSALEIKLKSSGKSKYKRPANNIFGTMFHRVMELYVLNQKEDVSVLVNRAIKENSVYLSNDVINEYKIYLTECCKAVIKLYDSSKLFTKYNLQEAEYKFCDYSDSLYGSIPTLMSGSIDLLVRNGHNILVIDYKTDSNHFENNDDFENSLKIKYQNQLETYKKVIGKLENISIEQIEAKIVWLEEKENDTVAHFLAI